MRIRAKLWPRIWRRERGRCNRFKKERDNLILGLSIIWINKTRLNNLIWDPPGIDQGRVQRRIKSRTKLKMIFNQGSDDVTVTFPRFRPISLEFPNPGKGCYDVIEYKLTPWLCFFLRTLIPQNSSNYISGIYSCSILSPWIKVR